MKQHYQAYATAQQTTAGTRQIVMLYDGMIRNLLAAREAIEQGKIEPRFNHLTKVSEIIFGLQGCLDFEKGGEIAKVLDNFYALIDLRIFSLHRDPSLETCDAVIQDIRRMRDVWDEIDRAQAGAPTESGNATPASAPEQQFTPPLATPGVTLSA